MIIRCGWNEKNVLAIPTAAHSPARACRVLPRSVPDPGGGYRFSSYLYTEFFTQRPGGWRWNVMILPPRDTAVFVLFQENRLGPGIWFFFWRALRRGSSKQREQKPVPTLYTCITFYTLGCVWYASLLHHPSPRASSTITIHCFFFLFFFSQGAGFVFSTFHCVDFFVLLLKLFYFYGECNIIRALCTARLFILFYFF